MPLAYTSWPSTPVFIVTRKEASSISSVSTGGNSCGKGRRGGGLNMVSSVGGGGNSRKHGIACTCLKMCHRIGCFGTLHLTSSRISPASLSFALRVRGYQSRLDCLMPAALRGMTVSPMSSWLVTSLCSLRRTCMKRIERLKSKVKVSFQMGSISCLIAAVCARPGPTRICAKMPLRSSPWMFRAMITSTLTWGRSWYWRW
mmetsp:Transcript_11901/g.44268  ORF Transcript_11901/g.44268 Transcript_11901/m.44268 type:complete len:201 (+) Transcript_11901:2852-3454(+)